MLPNGTLGSIDGTCPAGYGYDARVEILCEKGLIQIGDVKEPGFSQVRADGTTVGSAFKSWRDRFKDAYLEGGSCPQCRLWPLQPMH